MARTCLAVCAVCPSAPPPWPVCTISLSLTLSSPICQSGLTALEKGLRQEMSEPVRDWRRVAHCVPERGRVCGGTVRPEVGHLLDLWPVVPCGDSALSRAVGSRDRGCVPLGWLVQSMPPRPRCLCQEAAVRLLCSHQPRREHELSLGNGRFRILV